MTLKLVRTRRKIIKKRTIEERTRLTDKIKELHDYAVLNGSKGARFYYANISKLINKTAGVTSRKEANMYELSVLNTLEMVVIGAISQGLCKHWHYKEIYAYVKEKLTKLKDYI